VTAGEVVIVNVDYAFSHDAAGPLLISQLNKLDVGRTTKASDPNVLFFIDHAVPSPSKSCRTTNKL